MKTILVTGFTGNVGYEVAQKLLMHDATIRCAVRDIDKAQKAFGQQYNYVKFDFNHPETYGEALEGIHGVFLMFPPETEGPNVIHQFLEKAKEKGVKHITYLSVKDVQFMPFIPHYKNEKSINRTGIPFTFLRAGYFMQNLNMFLLNEILENDRIYIAAGRGKTSFIDVRDIAEVAARSLTEETRHINKKYVLTGSEALDFYEVAEMMSTILKRKIIYSNPAVKEFQQYMVKKGLEPGFVRVVTGLHLGTKLGFAKGITGEFADITNTQPIQLHQYLEDYKHYWTEK